MGWDGNAWYRMVRDRMGCDGMGRSRVGRDGAGWDGTGWDLRRRNGKGKGCMSRDGTNEVLQDLDKTVWDGVRWSGMKWNGVE